MTGLFLDGAELHFSGSDTPVYSDLSLRLPPATWTCLLGASGCGKSSLLHQLAGLIDAEHAQQIDCRSDDGEPLAGRLAWMGQRDLLYPWLSVLDNVCLQWRLGGRVPKAIRERGMALLAELHLSDVAQRRPDALSGGMRQRVALARTLIQDKPIVLMDEPFSALDALNRYRLQDLAAEKLSGRTVLMVTHDPQEALRLGDQLLLMRPGAPLETLTVPAGDPPRAVGSLGEEQAQLLHTLGVAA